MAPQLLTQVLQQRRLGAVLLEVAVDQLDGILANRAAKVSLGRGSDQAENGEGDGESLWVHDGLASGLTQKWGCIRLCNGFRGTGVGRPTRRYRRL